MCGTLICYSNHHLRVRRIIEKVPDRLGDPSAPEAIEEALRHSPKWPIGHHTHVATPQWVNHSTPPTPHPPKFLHI